jgi:hypothetical protein
MMHVKKIDLKPCASEASHQFTVTKSRPTSVFNTFTDMFKTFGILYSAFIALSKTIERKNETYRRNTIVRCFLETKTELYNLCSDFSTVSTGYYNLIKGAIQSGKSRIIQSLSFKCTMLDNGNVIIIVRNYTDDYHQIHKGVCEFIKEFKEYFMDETGEDVDEDELPKIYYMGDTKRKKSTKKLSDHQEICRQIQLGRAIIVCIANSEQISKLNDCLDIVKNRNDGINLRLNLVVDEVDQLMFSSGCSFKPQFDYLFIGSSV